MDTLYDMNYACLRYFNASGDLPHIGEDHSPETHLIPLVCRWLWVSEKKFISLVMITTRLMEPCVRDYIHVVDLAQAHILALHDLHNGSRKYNLGNGRGYSVKEVVETAREVTGHPIPAEITDRRPGIPQFLSLAVKRLMMN